MIHFRALTLARAGRPLVEDATLQIHPGQKIGLVGANGCGKSSLFALLRGELHAEHGDLYMPPGWVVADVGQETPAAEAAALDFVLDGDAELRRIEADLAAAEPAHDGMRIAELHGRLEEIGGHGARARAQALLAGLGFAPDSVGRPVASFSGGWRMRLALARALMCRSDLLLLDEPTNHLDLDAVLWLEGWLKGYPGTLLVISHDREFLDNVVSHIAHIAQQRLRLYSGNYADFERQRAGQLALQQAMFSRQQREVAHLHSFIDRFRAKATKARQAQSRLKALARLETLAPAHVDTPFGFEFAPPPAAPDPLLTLEDVAAGYGGIPVVERVKMVLRPGARIALLGPNGAGKSTLIRLLAGEIAPLAGKRREGRGLAVGYFAQHQLEQLRPDESALQHLLRLDPAAREQDLRDWLGGFDFRGDMANAPIAPFSGGEKARLALALIVRRRPNLLLLDEPTNHLDLEMRHALTLALQDYPGALVLVSHDRHLLRTCADELWLVADGCARPFDGDLDDYRGWLEQRRAVALAPAADDRPSPARRRDGRRLEALARNQLAARRRPLQQELKRVEHSMAQLEAHKRELDALLADPATYQGGDAEGVKAHVQRQGRLARELEAVEARWLELHEALEAEAAGPLSGS